MGRPGCVYLSRLRGTLDCQEPCDPASGGAASGVDVGAGAGQGMSVGLTHLPRGAHDLRLLSDATVAALDTLVFPQVTVSMVCTGGSWQ